MLERALSISPWILLLILCGCASTGDDGAGFPITQEVQTLVDAQEAFETLEARLLAATTVQIRGKITAEGAFVTDLNGHALLSPVNRATMQYSGTMGSTATRMDLVSDGKTMQGGAIAGRFNQSTPVALNEGILIGLTRMGILHNLARLLAGAPPDATDGTVKEWVTVSSFSLGDPVDRGHAIHQPVEFEITVDGVPSAKATLWIDLRTGLPARRTQTVQFGEETMHVLEDYEEFIVRP